MPVSHVKRAVIFGHAFPQRAGLPLPSSNGPDGHLGLDIHILDRPAPVLDDILMDTPGQMVVAGLAEPEELIALATFSGGNG